MQRSSSGAAVSALQQKEVIDEGAWDIGPEVRRAWGLSSGRSEDNSSLSYESSYLPFFTSSAPSGRSRYSKHGVKLAVEEEPEPGISGNTEDVSVSKETPGPSKKPSGISMQRSKLTLGTRSESSSVPVTQAPSSKPSFLRPRGVDSPSLHSNSHEKKRKVSSDDGDIHDRTRSPRSEFGSGSGETSRSPPNKTHTRDRPKKKKIWPPNDT